MKVISLTMSVRLSSAIAERCLLKMGFTKLSRKWYEKGKYTRKMFKHEFKRQDGFHVGITKQKSRVPIETVVEVHCDGFKNRRHVLIPFDSDGFVKGLEGSCLEVLREISNGHAHVALDAPIKIVSQQSHG